MKSKSLKNATLTGIGMTTGFIIYNLLFDANIDWVKAIFVGIFVLVLSLFINKFSKEKK